MGIFSRAADIIAANVADLLDRAEDPAKMIRLIIAEMEETLVEVRASAARSIADQKELKRGIAKLEQAQSNWAEKAQLALSKDRDDLAKAALVEKAKLGSLIDATKREIDTINEALRGYEADIHKLETKLREARARQAQAMSRIESADNRYKLRSVITGSKYNEAVMGFEVLDRRADAAEGRADAMDMGRPKTLEEEIAELRASDAVEAELQQMKARMGHKEA